MILTPTGCFFSANLNAFVPYEDFFISGRISYQYTQEDQNAYRERGPNTARSIGERHVDLTQVLIGLDVAYTLGKFEPFATFAYQNDFGQDDGTDAGGLPGSVGATQPVDDDEIRAGVGMRSFGDSISASLEWLKVFERDTYESDSIFLSIRADL